VCIDKVSNFSGQPYHYAFQHQQRSWPGTSAHVLWSERITLARVVGGPPCWPFMDPSNLNLSTGPWLDGTINLVDETIKFLRPVLGKSEVRFAQASTKATDQNWAAEAQ
jgi:hypothetical protein